MITIALSDIGVLVKSTIIDEQNKIERNKEIERCKKQNEVNMSNYLTNKSLT